MRTTFCTISERILTNTFPPWGFRIRGLHPWTTAHPFASIMILPFTAMVLWLGGRHYSFDLGGYSKMSRSPLKHKLPVRSALSLCFR